MPNSHKKTDPVEIDHVDARAGRRVKGMKTVLVVSIAIAAVGLATVFMFFA